MNAFSEDRFFEIFKEGDRERAFRMLVEEYSKPLYWHIRKIVLCHDDADDILQNVFIKVWQSLDSFRSDSKIYTWIHKIATNESLNFLSEKKRKVFGNRIEISTMLENSLVGDEYFNGDRAERALQRAILQLTERQRMVFNMRYFEDMTNDEVADELGIAVGTVKATYHQAVKKIEDELRI